MRRTLIASALFLLLGTAAAFAQASPMSEGPPGTPITPQQIGAWTFSESISQSEAEEDAREQGYRAVHGLYQDHYGDWIGSSARGGVIIFPDGHAFPL